MKVFAKSHKWLGVVASFFIIIFSLSGIFLNHRQAISKWDISRALLPSGYQYENWNNSSIKGGFALSPDSVLLYGGSGIWLTDSTRSDFSSYMDGLRSGADNKNTVNIARTGKGEVFALTTFNLYQLNRADNTWRDRTDALGTDERLSDICHKGDSLVVITRSHAYVSTPPYTNFEQIELPKPAGYKKSISLFRAIWTLHSGEIFGLLGRLVVDFMGVVFIILSVTGITVLLFPKIIKRTKTQAKKRRLSSYLRGSYRWHNKLGAWLLLLGIIVIVSGLFLRPPAMILIIRDKIKPLPGTAHNSSNPWFDKLRTIRYDDYNKEWLLYTSDGFYAMETLTATSTPITNAPMVSVMGVSVMEEIASGLWVVGSFNGLYYWDRASGISVDVAKMRQIYIGEQRVAGSLVEEQRGVISGIDVSGYVNSFSGEEFVFSYSSGALSVGKPAAFGDIPKELERGRMSLWHLSLEAHVGRIYTPIVNSLIGESLFVLLSGVVMLLIYISGYILYQRRRKRKRT